MEKKCLRCRCRIRHFWKKSSVHEGVVDLWGAKEPTNTPHPPEIYLTHHYWILIVDINVSDLDECTLGVSGCAHLCTNTPGSFTCSCRSGYQINSDLLTCSGKLPFCLLRNTSQGRNSTSDSVSKWKSCGLLWNGSATLPDNETETDADWLRVLHNSYTLHMHINIDISVLWC